MKNMEEMKNNRIPEFKTLEEEREYWEARGPLADGHKGTINRPKAKQKRSSFLAVRLTGEELTRLRDIAAKQRLGPSTYARIVLTSVIEQKTQLKTITVDQLKEAIVNLIPQSVKEKGVDLFEKTVIGDVNNPAMFIIDGSQLKGYEELTLSFFKAFLRLIGVQLVTPEDENYQSLKEKSVVKAQKEETKV